MATSTNSLSPRLSPRSKRMSDEKKEKWSKVFQGAINKGDAVVSDGEVKVPAKSSPNGEDLSGTYDKVEFKTYAGALAYFDGKETDVLSALSSAVSNTLKQGARQKLINDSVPEEIRKTRQAAKRLVGMPGWGNDENTIFEKLMAQAKAA